MGKKQRKRDPISGVVVNPISSLSLLHILLLLVSIPEPETAASFIKAQNSCEWFQHSVAKLTLSSEGEMGLFLAHPESGF